VTGNLARPYLSARGVAGLAERLSERDRAIIRQVAMLRLMSARQIQALHFPASEHDNELAATRARQRVIARLVRERLLMALTRRIGGVRAGSAGLVLALGPIGQRVLMLEGARHRVYEPTWRFVDHTLATSQLIVEVHLAARQGRLDLLDYQTEPASWRQFTGLGGRQVLRPDLYLSLGVREYELLWFVEVDRATESLPTVLGKCRLYGEYYQSGVEQALHDGVFPRVCWVVPDETRAERVQSAILQDRRLPERLFEVTTSEHALPTLSDYGNE
jgi:Replication-relaxation